MIDNLMEHLDSVNTAQSKHEQQTKPIKDIIRRAYMSAVSDYSSVDSTSLKEDVNMKIEEIKQQARRRKVKAKVKTRSIKQAKRKAKSKVTNEKGAQHA